jgi:hypothetical protein
MIDERDVFEQSFRRYEPEGGSFERLVRRRDRKRRNQRITAGVVGIAVFVAAVWIVTSGLSLDRSETSVVPGGDVTRPAVTGPAETGPALSGPVIGPTGDPYSVGFKGLPPRGATPSKPVRGELVLSDSGIHPWFAVNVYADGRLIWARDAAEVGDFAPTPMPEGGPVASEWIEQRLTPKGVELLRSGAVPLGGQLENPGEQLPLSAWEDPKLRPYVPSRYCLYAYHDPSQPADLLPSWAKDILRRSNRIEGFWSPCRDVTLDDARALGEAMRDAGFDYVGGFGGTGSAGAQLFSGEKLGVGSFEFVPLLPDGASYGVGG